MTRTIVIMVAICCCSNTVISHLSPVFPMNTHTHTHKRQTHERQQLDSWLPSVRLHLSQQKPSQPVSRQIKKPKLWGTTRENERSPWQYISHLSKGYGSSSRGREAREEGDQYCIHVYISIFFFLTVKEHERHHSKSNKEEQQERPQRFRIQTNSRQNDSNGISSYDAGGNLKNRTDSWQE